MTDILLPKVTIPIKSYQKLCAYIDLAKGEITGFADVEIDSEKLLFKIGEIYLIKQIATGGECEMDADDIAEFNYEYLKKNPDTEILPRVWWHSHDNLGAFFSTTDDDTIKEFSNGTFMLAIVGNKDHDFKINLSVYEPFEFIFEDLPLIIDHDVYTNTDEVEKEIKDKVTSTNHIPDKTTPNSTRPNYNYEDDYYNYAGYRTNKRKMIIFGENEDADFVKKGDVYRPKEIKMIDDYGKRTPLPLPKDFDKAIDKIIDLDLFVSWDSSRRKWIFLNLADDFYEDNSETFKQYIYIDLIELIADKKKEFVDAEDKEYLESMKDTKKKQKKGDLLNTNN